MFIKTLFVDPRLFFSQVLIVIFSICVHEYIHTLTAYKLGDTTAADHGHLSLNPLKQMGILSLLMLCFLGIAWGQVPVNTSNLRGRHAPALVAISGPLSNAVLSLLFCILVVIGNFFDIVNFALAMLYYGAIINMVLTLFNLLPVPGLDGWNVLRSYWKKDLSNSGELFKGIFFILIMLVFTCFDYLFRAAEIIVGGLLYVIMYIAGWIL